MIKANTDSEPSKERWLAKRKHWRNDPNKWFKVPRGHGSLSEPALWVYSHVLFFLLINNLLVSLLSICLWKCISTQLQARALSLATGSHGLVTRIQCSHCHGLTSVSGLHFLARELKSCSKPLQAEATWEQRESQPWRLSWFHVIFYDVQHLTTTTCFKSWLLLGFLATILWLLLLTSSEVFSHLPSSKGQFSSGLYSPLSQLTGHRTWTLFFGRATTYPLLKHVLS